MLFWFVGLAFVLVALIFASPAIDYRLVMIGSALPLVELLWGPPWVMHTLAFPTVTMALTMIVLRGRRLAQRRWLGLTIGLFMHLVLAGTWRHTALFWWPFFGRDVPVADAPRFFAMPWLAISEFVGVAALGWAVSRFGLLQAERQRRFLRTGQLDRSALVATGKC